jgi:pimeloyl-ACP methyl ester carboxylesterase
MSQAEPLSRFYHAHGLRLHYVVWGEEANPPMLLIHGGRDHARVWDALARAFLDDYAVYVPDLRGHGDSDWAPASEYAIPDFVADLAALLQIVWDGRDESQRLVIIGHSRGGGVALRLAGTYPDRLSHVVAIDGVGRHTRWHEPAPQRLRAWIARRQEADTWTERVYPSVEAAAARVREANPRFSPELAYELARYGTRPVVGGGVVWKFDPRVRFHPAYDFPDDELRQFFANIDAPVLLVRGDQSDRGEAQQGGDWSDSFQNARSVLVRGAGHWLQHERPAELLEILRDFLAIPAAAAGD